MCVNRNQAAKGLTHNYDVMFLCMYLCIYGAGPYIHKYIRPNISKFSPAVYNSSKTSLFEISTTLAVKKKLDDVKSTRQGSQNVLVCVYPCGPKDPLVFGRMYLSVFVYIRELTYPQTYVCNSNPHQTWADVRKGSRMYTNMAIFTNVHKYENRPQTYTIASLLTYTSTYARS